MAISKIKLPNNSVQDIHDSRITGVDSYPASGGSNVVTSGGVYSAIAAAISSVYRVKGTKSTYSQLPESGNIAGDVWNVTYGHDDFPPGTNWVWTGTEWDALGGEIDLSGYVEKSSIEAAPVSGSTDPISSGGVYTAIATAVFLGEVVETIEEETGD